MSNSSSDLFPVLPIWQRRAASRPGIPLWFSDVPPGNIHDLAAARENVRAVLRPFLEAMPVLAGPGCEGAGRGVHVPVKKPAGAKELDINTRARK